jgi:hypothetical protein
VRPSPPDASPLPLVPRSPVLGAIHERWQAKGGYEDVRHGDNQPSRSFEWFRRSDGNGEQTSFGIGLSIRPGTAVPSTVLVADMGDSSLLLAGWRDGPSAYLCSADAVPLRRELARAFGSTELAQCNSQGGSR